MPITISPCILVSPGSLLLFITSPGVVWMLSLIGLCVWMQFHPQAYNAPKVLLVIVGILIFRQLSDAVLNAENNAFPMKFDWLLYLLDKNLGISAFGVARLFADWQRPLLALIYQSLVYFMIFCYVLNLNRGDGRPGKLLVAYLVSFVVGPCLYLVVPGCGPRYAFGNTFPAGSPDVSPVLIKLSAWPNAIPSLHLSTALLFVLFAGRSRALRLVAWIYLLGTVAATLAFEHYVIDLIVAVPFGCFAALAAERKISKALANLGLVLAWLLAIRFATPALLVYPPVLRILAVATAGFAAFSVIDGQRSMSRQLPLSTTELPCPAPASHCQR